MPLVMTMLGRVSLLSPAYRCIPRPICLKLFRQVVRCARALALDKTGSNKRGENGDDGDDHEQFNERKCPLLPVIAGRIHGWNFTWENVASHG